MGGRRAYVGQEWEREEVHMEGSSTPPAMSWRTNRCPTQERGGKTGRKKSGRCGGGDEEEEESNGANQNVNPMFHVAPLVSSTQTQPAAVSLPLTLTRCESGIPIQNDSLIGLSSLAIANALPL